MRSEERGGRLVPGSNACVNGWRWRTHEYSKPERRAACLQAQKHRAFLLIFCGGLFIGLHPRAKTSRPKATPHSNPFK